MKHLIILLILIAGRLSFAYGQEFNDMIITSEHDTIVCNITLVNNYNIFYKYNPKKKTIKSGIISRADVIYFSVDEDVEVMEEEEEPRENVFFGFKEEYGLIYPKIYETPPKFQNGLFDLNYFIEQNTRVYLRDIKVFQEKTAIVLYKISIDSIGNVLEVTVKEPTASTGYFDYQSMYLDGEILRVIEMTKKWAPAKIDGKAVDSEIYLPLKFYLDGNRIVLLPSKYIFQYTNRE